jgi:hypothetical protein
MDTTPKTKTTAMDFFLYLGFITSLYVFIGTFATFIFSIINTLFPDRQYNYYDPYGSAMRFSVSVLIVATPLFMFLLKKIYAHLREDAEGANLWIRRWGLYLTLFLAIAALSIDLVVLINTFLGGEISARFVAKAVTVLALSGAVWWFTRQELHNSLAFRPKLAKGLGWGVAAVVLLSLVVGFSYIGSPTLLRNIRDDNQREQDLSNIRYQILEYYQTKNATLPKTLDEMTLGNPYSQEIPLDPKSMQAYGYTITEPQIVDKVAFPAFELCAVFAEDGAVDKRVQGLGGGESMSYATYDSAFPSEIQNDFSMHPAGNKCFEISIDPERFHPRDAYMPEKVI